MPDSIEHIRVAVATGRCRFSTHCRRQAAQRGISVKEILEAVTRGEVIEEYSADPRGRSCLIYGTTLQGRSLHVQASLPAPEVIFITVYQPDPAEWIDFRKRRAVL